MDMCKSTEKENWAHESSYIKKKREEKKMLAMSQYIESLSNKGAT